MKFPRNIKVLSKKIAAKLTQYMGAYVCIGATALVLTTFTGNAAIAAASGNSSVNNPTPAASKVAIVTTTRQPSTASFATLQPAAQTRSAPPAPTTQVIYKLIDAQGRTTYADSPMAGAQKVALPDLTIMDSQWPSALATANAAPTVQTNESAPSLPAAPSVAAPTPAATSTAPTSKAATKALPAPFTMVPVGTIATVNDAQATTPTESVKLIMASNSQSIGTQNDAATPPFPVFEKLRADSAIDPQLLAAAQRRKMLETELRQEETLSREIRQTLAKEEAESVGFRLKSQELAQALKKNITPTAEQKNAKEALLAHFERKRLLQDELTAHERTAEALREVLRSR
jgi:hypothetical protein